MYEFRTTQWSSEENVPMNNYNDIFRKRLERYSQGILTREVMLGLVCRCRLTENNIYIYMYIYIYIEF